jgi:hypothetical protein
MVWGVIGSFTDAPGGFHEEIHEVTVSTGMEYWYRKAIAARIGYFYEANDKGGRKYLTTGVGARYRGLAFDLAYVIPANSQNNALVETLRFTLMFVVNRNS